MLDFQELGGNGRGLEQLVREMLLLMDMHPQWSGTGPDGGRDLLFDETGLDLFGKKIRTWLVSCKDYSNSGRAVGIEDLGAIVEAAQQHGAQGFLLVCTTHPSAAAVERLKAIESNKANPLVTHVWDGVTLERLLSSPRAWAVAQRFMPSSTDAAGWKIFGTDVPNKWVAVHRGHYFHLSSRVAGGIKYDFESLDRRIDELDTLESDIRRFRIRGIWHNDAHGAGYLWYIDCMVPSGSCHPRISDLEDELLDGISCEDGQFHSFDIVIRETEWHRDHFDIDHYEFYRRLPSYV